MTDMPRCETCTWWKLETDDYVQEPEESWGICGLSESSRDIPVHPETLAIARDYESYEAFVRTHRTYGCVQHEPADDGVLIGRGSERVQLDIAQMMRNADDAIATMED